MEDEDLSGIEEFDLGALMGNPVPEGDTAPPADGTPAPAPEMAADDPTDESSEGDELPAPPATNDRLGEVLERLAAKLDAPAPAAPGPGATEKEKKDFAFAITQAQLPPELLGKLMSEDPTERTQGMLALLSGALNMARKRWRTEVDEEYQPGFRQLVQEHYAQEITNRDRAADFAASFPSVAKHPEGKLIAQTLSERAVKAMVAARVPQDQLTYGTTFKKYFKAELAKITTGRPAAGGPRPAADAGTRAARQVSRNGAPPAERPGNSKTLGDFILDVVS